MTDVSLSHCIRPLLKHWRGEYALLPTLLVTLLGLRFVVSTLPVQHYFPAALIAACATCLILVWQVIGTWRSANADLASFGSPFTVWLSYGAIAVASVLTSLQVVDQLSGKPSFQAMLAGYSKTQTLPVEADGETTTIKGDIDYDTRDALLNTLARNPDIRTVNLDSEGGLIYAARIIASVVGEKKLNTHVSNRCFSACTLILMAGDQRTAAERARLGFHQYQFIKVHPLRETSAADEQGTDLAYFRQRGISEDFLRRIYEMPHDQIWNPERRVLLAAGVITN